MDFQAFRPKSPELCSPTQDLEAPKGIKETKAALLDKLTAIHDGWIFKDEKKVERSVESLDKEKKKLWDVVETMFD